jgi:hypothetical protein
MSYIYLQEQGEESLADSYLDIPQSVLLKLKNTQDKSYCSDNETESCQNFQSGTTSAHSTVDRGAEQLTFWQEDSHAKTLVQQVKEQELPEHVRDCGKSMRELLTKYGLDLSLPKIHHCFELGDLELSSKIWPRWGMMLDGACWELGMSVRRIKETECGSWPTPTTMDKLPPKSPEALHKEATVARPGRSRPANLRDCVHPEQMKAWPTPCTRDYKGTNAPEGLIRKDGKSRMDQLPNAVAYGGNKIQQTYPTPRCFMHKDALTDRGKSNLGEVINEKEQMTKTGQLNPAWVEWLMGWPIGWTGLKPLETDKYRNVQQWHSEFYHKD